MLQEGAGTVKLSLPYGEKDPLAGASPDRLKGPPEKRPGPDPMARPHLAGRTTVHFRPRTIFAPPPQKVYNYFLMNTLKIGDKVIYPNHGIGVVEAIVDNSFDGESIKVVQVRILANDTVVLVPLTGTDEIGIRRPVEENTIKKLFHFIKSTEIDITTDWKDRYKENLNLMRSGTLFDMALVLKSLYCLGQVKPLSFREKKMLERARELIVTELSEATDVPCLKIEQRLTHALAESSKHIKETMLT